MITVNKSQVMLETGVDFARGAALTGEASTMGLPPGEWPDFIAVVDDRNEGFLFQRSHPTVLNGELANYAYCTRAGQKLTVFND